MSSKNICDQICNCKRTGTTSNFSHFVPDVQPHGNYSEMFMYNTVKNNEPSFCRHLNVSRTWYSIYENTKAVLNSSGYSFHAFKIITSNRPTHQVLVMLGNALCETLNRIRQNNNTACVEKDNLYWLTQSDCVWAEIVGVNKAQEYLLDKLGNTTNTPNVYDQNRELIHSHFHPNTLPSELNKILGGPSPSVPYAHSTRPHRGRNNMSTKILIHLSCCTLMKKNSCNCFQH